MANLTDYFTFWKGFPLPRRCGLRIWTLPRRAAFRPLQRPSGMGETIRLWLSKGEAASTPRSGLLAIGGSVKMRPVAAEHHQGQVPRPPPGGADAPDAATLPPPGVWGDERPWPRPGIYTFVDTARNGNPPRWRQVMVSTVDLLPRAARVVQPGIRRPQEF
jgi:hypothetical protein